jgi:methylmalonyl-CoA mutase cobalamin-binding subunit
MFNAVATVQFGKKVVLACAAQDQHELGLLLLALNLRRQGFRVIYLGPNISATDFHHLIETALPDLICFSAASVEAGRVLATLSRQCVANLTIQQAGSGSLLTAGPIFTFGGGAFTQKPSLVAQVQGLYLGDSIEAAITKIQRLFSQ